MAVTEKKKIRAGGAAERGDWFKKWVAGDRIF